MIYELSDTSKVKNMFTGLDDVGIIACIQKVMGKIYVTDTENPKSAMAYVGAFAFYAGEPDRELVINKPEGFIFMVPDNDIAANLFHSFGFKENGEKIGYTIVAAKKL